MTVIQVDNLSKTFKVPEREGGLAAALGSVFARKYKLVEAVKGVSFNIEPAEIVGFLGPNGAGKTTTLKMLSGLLHPTSGSASVLGYTPWQRDSDYLRRISMVMGQRSQLNWDLPPIDSFHVHRAVYQVDKVKGQQRLDELIALLDIADVLRKQVRTLSLGERMKCEICVSLLHQPDVLFLDEPTLGVDITMQARIREFIAEYNRRYGATIILTSHYMADVTALCKRLVVIDHGQILYDGPLADLSARLAPFKVIQIELVRDVDGYDFERLGSVLSREDHKITLRINKDEAAAVTTHLLAELPILDLTIQDPPIEDIIRNVFAARPGEPLVKAVVAAIPAYLWMSLQTMFMYRAEMILWAIWGIVYPAVALAMWAAAIAGSADGHQIGSFAAQDFAAYFLITMIVGHLSTAWDIYEMGFLVRSGLMSPRLLRPILPIWQSMADNTAYKVLTLFIVLPIWGVVVWLAQPDFSHTTATHLAWGIPATILAAALNYLWGYNLALLAFWITRMDAVGQIWFGVSMLFGGRVAPLSILPGPLQWIAVLLPFKYIIWFPSALLMGRFDTTQAMNGVLAQLAWLVAAIMTFKVLWRLAIRQYSAVGA